MAPGITRYKTSTFTTDAVGDPEAIPVHIICRKIRIWPQDGTSQYYVYAPLKTATPILKYAGEVTELLRPSPGHYQQTSYGDPGYWDPDDVAPGYVAALSGTITMCEEEIA